MFFDFGECHDEPVVIRVRGKEFKLPRMLNPGLIEWSAEIRKQINDDATAHLLREESKNEEEVKAGREQKARFLMYWQSSPIDVVDLLKRVTTPEGIDFVVERQCRKAGMTDEEIDVLFLGADPAKLRRLADELTTSADIIKANEIAGEAGGSPLTGAKPASEGSRGTGGETTPSSHTPTEGLTSAPLPLGDISISSTPLAHDGSPRRNESDSSAALSSST
jgi:hypothetical protein